MSSRPKMQREKFIPTQLYSQLMNWLQYKQYLYICQTFTFFMSNGTARVKSD